MMFFVIRWKRINEFILFNVNVFNLGYHYAWKGVPTLCVSNRMVILLRERWLVGNMKRIYFYHELVVDQFCGRAVTGINPVTSAFYISCRCFEVGVATNEKKDKYRNMLLHMNTFYILLCLSFSSFYLLKCLFTKNIYVWLCIHPFVFVKSIISWRRNTICCVMPHTI